MKPQSRHHYPSNAPPVPQPHPTLSKLEQDLLSNHQKQNRDRDTHPFSHKASRTYLVKDMMHVAHGNDNHLPAAILQSNPKRNMVVAAAAPHHKSPVNSPFESNDSRTVRLVPGTFTQEQKRLINTQSQSHPVLSQVGTIKKSLLEERAQKIVHPNLPFEKSNPSGRTRVSRSTTSSAPRLHGNQPIQRSSHSNDRHLEGTEQARFIKDDAISLQAELSFDPAHSDVNLIPFSHHGRDSTTQPRTLATIKDDPKQSTSSLTSSSSSGLMSSNENATHRSSSLPISRDASDDLRQKIRVTPTDPMKEYQYKPPAAAKYYLWDTTSDSAPCLWTSRDLALDRIEISRPAINAINTFLEKQWKSMPRSKNIPKIGYGIGRYISFRSQIIEQASKANCLSLIVDRFDQGKRVNDILCPTILRPEDVVLPILFLEKSEHLCHLYEQMLGEFRNHRLFDIFSGTDGFLFVIGNDPSSWTIQACQIKHNYSLKCHRIRPIRPVPSTLYMELTDSEGIESTKNQWGLLTIDQARHAYFLSNADPKVRELPLVGMWFNLGTPSDHDVRLRIVSYLSDSFLPKMDTGKPHFLVCFFLKGKPEFWQYEFSVDTNENIIDSKDLSTKAAIIMVQSRVPGPCLKNSMSNEGDEPIILEMDDVNMEECESFCEAFETVFGVHIGVRSVSQDKSGEDKDMPTSESDVKDNHVLSFTNTQESDPNLVSDEVLQSDAHDEQALNASTPNPQSQLSHAQQQMIPPQFNALPHSNFQMMPSDPSNWYMMMLQRQVEVLQTQLLSLTMSAAQSNSTASPFLPPRATHEKRQNTPTLSISPIHVVSIPPVEEELVVVSKIDVGTNTEEKMVGLDKADKSESPESFLEKAIASSCPESPEAGSRDGRVIIPDLVDDPDKSFVFDSQKNVDGDADNIWSNLHSIKTIQKRESAPSLPVDRKNREILQHAQSHQSSKVTNEASSVTKKEQDAPPLASSQNIKSKNLAPITEEASTFSAYENYSLASLEYLEKYGLLPAANQSFLDDDITDIADLRPKRQLALQTEFYESDIDTSAQLDASSLCGIDPSKESIISSLKPPLPPTTSANAISTYGTRHPFDPRHIELVSHSRIK